MDHSYHEFDRFYLSVITKCTHNIILDISNKIKNKVKNLKEQPQMKRIVTYKFFIASFNNIYKSKKKNAYIKREMVFSN